MLRLFCQTALIFLCFTLSPCLLAFAGQTKADYTETVTKMEFVVIPGGTFVMGDNSDNFASPEHEVSIKTFLLGRYEVTYEQYAKFCTATGRLLPSDQGWGMAKRPVVDVTWDDAVAFTEWLSEQSGKRMRLPSEAEWEYAARSGTITKYPWGDEIGKNKANCDGCGSQWDGLMTSPVGSFPPNGFGLYDMIGNVYEWCLDAKHDNYLGAPTDGSARLDDGPDGRRVNRGGSWYYLPGDAVVTVRCWEHPDKSQKDFGFRVLMEK